MPSVYWCRHATVYLDDVDTVVQGAGVVLNDLDPDWTLLAPPWLLLLQPTAFLSLLLELITIQFNLANFPILIIR